MDQVKIAWYGKHFGEEPPLTGSKKQGAGTIFFCGCNLHCVYCQNYQISQENKGQLYSVSELSDIMIDLQKQGAINIDLITPTIWYKQIKQALVEAKKKGLTIPIIWNSNAYETPELLKTMTNLIDIYLPDFKYSDDSLAEKYSGVKNYTQTALKAIKEMFEQVGNYKENNDGLAQKGIIVRHLILPGQIQNSLNCLKEISQINPNIYFSLMSQYQPTYKANLYPELNHPLTESDYNQVFDYMCKIGLTNGWTQAYDNKTNLLPNFEKNKPFSSI